MGARSTGSIARGGKVKKKSKFSALEKMERGRIGAQAKRLKGKFVDLNLGTGRLGASGDRDVRSAVASVQAGVVRERFKRNPLPRANRSR